jgi:tellurite resistance protein
MIDTRVDYHRFNNLRLLQSVIMNSLMISTMTQSVEEPQKNDCTKFLCNVIDNDEVDDDQLR